MEVTDAANRQREGLTNLVRGKAVHGCESTRAHADDASMFRVDPSLLLYLNRRPVWDSSRFAATCTVRPAALVSVPPQAPSLSVSDPRVL